MRAIIMWVLMTLNASMCIRDSVSGAEYDDTGKTESEGIRQKSVPTIERRGLAAVSSSFFAALSSAFGKYDVVPHNSP